MIKLKLYSLFTCFCLLWGCGITGKTKVMELDLEIPESQKPAAQIDIVSVGIADESTRLVAAGVYEWGEFNEEDLKNLHQSLRNTISRNEGEAYNSKSTLNIHVIILKYQVGSDSAGVAVLSSIAWCASDLNNNIVHHEQFYASNSGTLVVTLGAIKNSVNKAIIKRVAQSSIYLANGLKDQLPLQIPKTYQSFEESIKRLPKSFGMTSTRRYEKVGPLLISYNGEMVGEIKSADWKWAETSDQVDWEKYLSLQAK